MARRRRGRKASSRRRRRTRRNYYGPGMLLNPKRRRRGRKASPKRRRRSALRGNPRHRRARRHYRRNPGIMGITLPPLDAVLATGAGVVVPPIVAGYVMKMLPADWQTSRATYWLVKIGSAIVPSMIVRQYVNRRWGNFMLIGGAASLAIDAVRKFMPGVIPGLGAQPFLGRMGAYYDRPQNIVPYGRPRAALTPMMEGVPDRLMPQTRF